MSVRIISVFVLVSGIPLQALSACLNPVSDVPSQQFDFLLGEHEVTLHAWTAQGWSPPRPINAR